MDEFPILLQQDNVDCGPTCLRMICLYFGRHFSLPFIQRLTNKTHAGVSLFDISSAATLLELDNLGVKLDIERIRKAPLPCILHWRRNHFVILHKIQNGKFFIADPAKGRLIVDEVRFAENWLPGNEAEIGNVLLINPGPGFYKLVEM